jgi:phosphoglycerate dehydrogenase-like enzyme
VSRSHTEKTPAKRFCLTGGKQKQRWKKLESPQFGHIFAARPAGWFYNRAMSLLVHLPTNTSLVPRLRSAFPDLVVIDADTPAALTERIGEAEVLVIPNGQYSAEIARAVKERGRRLRWIQFTTAGIDWAIKAGLPDNVIVTNASGFNAGTVSEHALALMLAVARRLPDSERARGARQWPRRAMMDGMMPLEGATLMLVGLGAIGREIARKAKAFDMRVIGISRIADKSSKGPVPHVDEVRPRARILETAREADVVALAVNYDSSTHRIVDRAVIAALKPTAIVVNVARGQLIDEAALIEALRAGRIAGAGLDVAETEPPHPDNPLWTLSNVVMTPHSAGGGGEKIEKLFAIVAENVRCWRAGEPLQFQIADLALPPDPPARPFAGQHDPGHAP